MKFFCLFLFEINSKFIYIRSAPSVTPLLNIFYNLFHLQEHIASTWNTSIDLDVWRNLYTVTRLLFCFTSRLFLGSYSNEFLLTHSWHLLLIVASSKNCYFWHLNLFLVLPMNWSQRQMKWNTNESEFRWHSFACRSTWKNSGSVLGRTVDEEAATGFSSKTFHKKFEIHKKIKKCPSNSDEVLLNEWLHCWSSDQTIKLFSNRSWVKQTVK